jgi:hypothetical protein
MLVMVWLIQGYVQTPSSLSCHLPIAKTLFTLLFLGFKVCDYLLQASVHIEHIGVQLFPNNVYRYIQLM